jgi:GNAT superfamily N-acetyltransferase
MVRELLPPDTSLAFHAMRELRPQLVDEAAFVELVDDVLRPEGFRLIGSTEGGTCVAVAGFRVATSISWGRHVYVHDLSTLPAHRGRGHASRLLGWIDVEARRRGCDQVHLDSGHDREDAHRLYLAQGYQDVARHFARR